MNKMEMALLLASGLASRTSFPWGSKYRPSQVPEHVPDPERERKAQEKRARKAQRFVRELQPVVPAQSKKQAWGVDDRNLAVPPAQSEKQAWGVDDRNLAVPPEQMLWSVHPLAKQRVKCAKCRAYMMGVPTKATPRARSYAQHTLCTECIAV